MNIENKIHGYMTQWHNDTKLILWHTLIYGQKLKKKELNNLFIDTNDTTRTLLNCSDFFFYFLKFYFREDNIDALPLTITIIKFYVK